MNRPQTEREVPMCDDHYDCGTCAAREKAIEVQWAARLRALEEALPPLVNSFLKNAALHLCEHYGPDDLMSAGDDQACDSLTEPRQALGGKDGGSDE